MVQVGALLTHDAHVRVGQHERGNGTQTYPPGALTPSTPPTVSWQ